MHSIIGGQLEQSLAISIGHQIIKDVHLSNLEIICQNISSSLLLLSTVNAGQVLFCPKIYCSSLIFQNPSKMASLTKPPKQPLFWTHQKILIHSVWKSHKKSHFTTLRAKRAMVSQQLSVAPIFTPFGRNEIFMGDFQTLWTEEPKSVNTWTNVLNCPSAV